MEDIDKLMIKLKELEFIQTQLIQSAKLASLGGLATSVAHQIINPLTSIMGYASLLLKELSPDDPKIKDIELIEREAHRIREIVEKLVDFALPPTKAKTECEVNEIIRETLSLIREQITLSNIRLLEQYETQLSKLLANPNQIKQVFFNIIRNAMEAMPTGGVLKIKTFNEGRQIKISFADTGIGIPEDHSNKIFEPFFSTKFTEKGVGLGLSVSKGIIEEHGGSISFETESGKGTTFTLSFPAKEK